MIRILNILITCNQICLSYDLTILTPTIHSVGVAIATICIIYIIIYRKFIYIICYQYTNRVSAYKFYIYIFLKNFKIRTNQIYQYNNYIHTVNIYKF